MALPGVNQFFTNAYQKMGKIQKSKQNDKQTNQNKAENTSKNVYGKSAEYVKSKNEKDISKSKTDSISGTSQKVELSDKAKEYLQKLREKYTNMDIMVGDNLSNEEANRYLSQGKGEYNVMIDVETLEKMANDESVSAEYEGILDNAGNTFNTIKEELGEDAKYVKSIGISIDNKGNTSYFSIIDQSLQKRPENMKKDKDDHISRAADKNKENYKKSSENAVSVSSDSIKDLIDKIREAIENNKNRNNIEELPNFDISV